MITCYNSMLQIVLLQYPSQVNIAMIITAFKKKKKPNKLLQSAES